MDQAENLRNIIKQSNQRPSLARVVTVTSGKGGVGKSNLAVNLAIQLSRMGKRVVVLDADFGLANVEVMLGIRPRYTLADLIFHGKNLSEIITMGPENIGFISGGSGMQELTNLTKEQIIYLTKKLSELDDFMDVIIVDTGAGIGAAVLEFITASSEVLLVATPEPTSITDAYALLKTLDRKQEFSDKETILKFVANRVNNENEGRELFQKFNEVIEKFLDLKLEYLGSILQDSNVSKAVIQQKPITVLYPNSNAAISYHRIGSNLLQVPVEETRKKGIGGLFSKLIKTKLH